MKYYLLLFYLQTFKCIVRLYFQTLSETSFNQTKFINILPFNHIYTTLYVGSNSQPVKLNIQLHNPYISILDINFHTHNNNKFDSSKSSTYQEGNYINVYKTEDAPLESEFIIFNYSGFHSNDLLLFDDKKTQIDNCYFINVNQSNVLHTFDYNDGILGLDIRKDDQLSINASLISQLKKNNFINTEVFYFSYTNDNEGYLIIGDYPHNVSSEYKMEDLVETYAYSYSSEVLWGIYFDNIKYNGSELSSLKLAVFAIENGFILCPNTFKDVIEKAFFKQYIDKGYCKRESDEYENYSCDDTSKVDYSLFPKLEFYHKELNMTFSFDYNDLFYSYEKRKYSLLYFNYDQFWDSYWILGKPFFRKYQMYFKPDSKRIGFYQTRAKDSFNYWIIVTIILLLAILGGIVYYFLFVRVKPRKKRVIELDEEFDYIPYKK